MCEYTSHTMVAVCVNVILLSIWPSSNLKTRAYEKKISEVLWTKRIEQLKGREGNQISLPFTDLIKMAAEWWHDGQHWLKALGCMTRENPGCVCVCTFVRESCFYLVHLLPQSIPYIWTSHRLSDPRPLNTWIGPVYESPHTFNKSG